MEKVPLRPQLPHEGDTVTPASSPFPAPGVGGAGGPESALQVSLSGRARPGLQPRTCSWFPRASQSRQEDSLLESASDVFAVRALPGDPCGEGKPQPDREDAPHPPCRCATTHHAARASPPLSAVPWPRVPHHPRTDLGGEQPPPRGQDSRGLRSTLYGSSVHSTWGPTCRAAQSHSKWLGTRFSTEGSKRRSSAQRGKWHRRPPLARLRGRTTPLLVQETGQPGTGRHTLAAVGLRRGGVQPASPHACGFAGTGRIHVWVSPGPGGHTHFALDCNVCQLTREACLSPRASGSHMRASHQGQTPRTPRHVLQEGRDLRDPRCSRPPPAPSQASENREGRGALTQQGLRAGHTQAPGGHKPTRLQTAAPSEQALCRQAWQGGWKEGSCCPKEVKSV